MDSYDFVILGGGPGGYTAALRAAVKGASVALIEREALGGACLNWGCIPTKTLLKGAKLFELMGHGQTYGISCSDLRADLSAMIQRKNKVVNSLVGALVKLMKQHKIDVFNGIGRLTGPRTLTAATADGPVELTGKNVILAVGGEPRELPFLPVDGKTVHTVKTLLDHDSIPEHLLVIGAGVAGMEFAQVFSSLGARITVVEILDKAIQGLDPDIDKTLMRTFKKRKYKMYFGAKIDKIEVNPGAVRAELASGEVIEADLCLAAVGQKPLTEGIGLEAAGLETVGPGFIPVDEQCRTKVESVYAIGDATGRIALAHFAAHMGKVAVDHALGEPVALDELAVPKAVFTDPEMGWVGLTEPEAVEKYGSAVTGQYLYRGLGMSQAEGKLDGLVKIVAQPETNQVVGLHILGEQAASLCAEGTLALKKGVTLRELAETIHAHPTYSETIQEAAEAALGLAGH